DRTNNLSVRLIFPRKEEESMSVEPTSAVQKFIASARELHAEENDPAKRWEKMIPLLQQLLADPSVKEQSTKWPDCSQGGERVDDRSKSDYAEVRKTVNVKVGAGKIDLVPPYEIHAEESGEERTVAIIVRAEKAGGFLQGRYDPTTKKYWQGYGPKQIPYELK